MATNYSIYQPDPTELAAHQEKADETLRMFNQSAPRAMEGETVASYRRRMASKIQSHAPNMKDVNINEAMGSAFDLIEKQIYEAAQREALHPTNIPEGELREVKKLDRSGREFSTFYGSPSSWMNNFSTGARRRLVGIRTETQRGYRPGNLG